MRPIQTMDGGREVNEVFFDDVKVPVENLVGQEHRGWDCAKFLLGNERTGIARVGYSKQRVQRIKELAGRVKAGDKPLIEDERFREKVAAVEVELKALEMTQMRVLSEDRQRKNNLPNPKSSILKIKGSEIQQATTAAAARDRRAAGAALPAGGATIPSSAPTSRPWTSIGRRRRRPPTSTTARPRSTAAPTRSSATSSPRPCWASDRDTRAAHAPLLLAGRGWGEGSNELSCGGFTPPLSSPRQGGRSAAARAAIGKSGFVRRVQ